MANGTLHFGRATTTSQMTPGGLNTAVTIPLTASGGRMDDESRNQVRAVLAAHYGVRLAPGHLRALSGGRTFWFHVFSDRAEVEIYDV